MLVFGHALPILALTLLSIPDLVHSGIESKANSEDRIKLVMDQAKSEIEAEDEMRHVENSLDNGGVDPTRKVSENSIKMEKQNRLFKRASEIMNREAGSHQVYTRTDQFISKETEYEGEVILCSAGGQESLTTLSLLPACNKASVKCNPEDTFRSFNGTCNNLQNPLWGSKGIAFNRLEDPACADGHSVPRGGFESGVAGQCGEPPLPNKESCGNDPKSRLPNPRLVSLEFRNVEKHRASVATNMLTQFGQFLDHDLTMTPVPQDRAACCKDPHGTKHCFPIRIPCGDPGFLKHCPKERDGEPVQKEDDKCQCDDFLEFERSIPYCESAVTPRQQMNDITAFVDASNVYESDQLRANRLRAKPSGELKQSTGNLLPQLPFNGSIRTESGDVRAREMPGLLAMHTLFMREHNRLAKGLSELNSFKDDEHIFQHARRIVIAQMQNIVYGQFLPEVLGRERMEQYEITLTPNTFYDSFMDPTMINSFATAAFRYGHSMIPEQIEMRDTNSNEVTRTISLHEHFFNEARYRPPENEQHSYMEELINGMIHQPAAKMDMITSKHLHDDLFRNVRGKDDDLISRNIQRGRDHGLPGYYQFRNFCGMPIHCSWEEVPEDIPEHVWKTFQQLYSSPGDIDLFIGGMAEIPIDEGSLVGATFNCIIGEQFHRTMHGDRFFFTHSEGPNLVFPFSEAQMEVLMRRRLEDVICDNTLIKTVTNNVFRQDGKSLECGKHEKLDLNLFLSKP